MTQATKVTDEPTFKLPRHAPLLFPLPRQNGVDPFFGCTRSYWNLLILPNGRNDFKPQVKSVVDRTRSNARKDGRGARGKRLIVFRSALDYFNRLASAE